MRAVRDIEDVSTHRNVNRGSLHAERTWLLPLQLKAPGAAFVMTQESGSERGRSLFSITALSLPVPASALA